VLIIINLLHHQRDSASIWASPIPVASTEFNLLPTIAASEHGGAGCQQLVLLAMMAICVNSAICDYRIWRRRRRWRLDVQLPLLSAQLALDLAGANIDRKLTTKLPGKVADFSLIKLD
jgi:hypothetical protein